MLEIIGLIYFGIRIGKIAQRKGQSVIKWRIIMILAWVGMEFFGIMIGASFFDITNLFSILIVGLAFAVTGYYMVEKKLEQLPDLE